MLLSFLRPDSTWTFTKWPPDHFSPRCAPSRAAPASLLLAPSRPPPRAQLSPRRPPPSQPQPPLNVGPSSSSPAPSSPPASSSVPLSPSSPPDRQSLISFGPLLHHRLWRRRVQKRRSLWRGWRGSCKGWRWSRGLRRRESLTRIRSRNTSRPHRPRSKHPSPPRPTLPPPPPPRPSQSTLSRAPTPQHPPVRTPSRVFPFEVHRNSRCRHWCLRRGTRGRVC